MGLEQWLSGKDHWLLRGPEFDPQYPHGNLQPWDPTLLASKSSSCMCFTDVYESKNTHMHKE